MRTTVRLEESLMSQARREAARRGVTLTALIEQGLRLVLRKPSKRPGPNRVSLPVSRAKGGALPGIDLNDSADLLDRMGER
jgi:hypothetical protein